MTRIRTPLLFAAILAATLAACSDIKQRTAYLNTLVGESELSLVHQLGVPSRHYELNGHKFLVYDDNSSGCETTFDIFQDRVQNARLNGSGC